MDDRLRQPAAWVVVLGIATSCWLVLPNAVAQITTVPRTDLLAGDFFGASVAIHEDFVLVGAPGIDRCGAHSGAAYVYRRVEQAEEWVLEAELQPDDCEAEMFFGRSVDLSDRFAVVAASREYFSQEKANAAYVFEQGEESGAWHQVAKLTNEPTSREGSFAMDVSIDGNRLLSTTSGTLSTPPTDGAAYVFEVDPETGTWRRTHRLEGSGTMARGVFGAAAALAGSVVAVAASTWFENAPGSVFVFEIDPTGHWSEVERFGEIDGFFISVDAEPERVLIGESKANRDRSGSATILKRRDGGGWEIEQVLQPKQPYRAGAFGSNVALTGQYALVVGFDEQLGLETNIDRVVFVFKHDAATDRWVQHHVIDVGQVFFGADVDAYGRYAVVGSTSEDAPGTAYVVRWPE